MAVTMVIGNDPKITASLFAPGYTIASVIANEFTEATGDLYMSGSHCKIEELSGKFAITDLNSRNGTFLRIKAERELGHGDYLFIGRKLLRVEITAALPGPRWRSRDSSLTATPESHPQ